MQDFEKGLPTFIIDTINCLLALGVGVVPRQKKRLTINSVESSLLLPFISTAFSRNCMGKCHKCVSVIGYDPKPVILIQI